jgi:hypothetical protein
MELIFLIKDGHDCYDNIKINNDDVIVWIEWSWFESISPLSFLDFECVTKLRDEYFESDISRKFGDALGEHCHRHLLKKWRTQHMVQKTFLIEVDQLSEDVWSVWDEMNDPQLSKLEFL